MNEKRAEELSLVGVLLEDTLDVVARMKNMTNLECQLIAMTFDVNVILNCAHGDVKVLKSLIECSEIYANKFRHRLISACEMELKVNSEKFECYDRREEDPSGD